MIDVSSIKLQLLRFILEESEKFASLPEEQKKKDIERMADLPEKEQKELCKFFMNEEKDSLPQKVLSKILTHINNVAQSLTNVSEKDKETQKTAKESRQNITNLINF